MKSLTLATVFAAVLASSTLIAEGAVLTVADVMEKYAGVYDIQSIKLDGSVYELTVLNSSGARVELVVDATTGDLVASNDDNVDEVDVADDETVDQPGVDDSDSVSSGDDGIESEDSGDDGTESEDSGEGSGGGSDSVGEGSD